MSEKLHVMEKFFEVFLLMGLAGWILGTMILLFSNMSDSPAGALIGGGTGLIIVGLSGYVAFLREKKRGKIAINFVGSVLVILSLSIAAFIATGVSSKSIGIIGSSFFSFGFFVLSMNSFLEGKLSKRVAITFGIPIFVAGIALFVLYGLRPPYQDYMFISVLPLLSGGILVATGKIGFEIMKNSPASFELN